MFITKQFEFSGLSEIDCLEAMTKKLNLLETFLKEEYGGTYNLDIISINPFWSLCNAFKILKVVIVFKTSTFVCSVEFEEFWEKFILFYEKIQLSCLEKKEADCLE